MAGRAEIEHVMDLWYKQENDALHAEIAVLQRRLTLSQHVVQMNRSIINNIRNERNIFQRVLEELFGNNPALAQEFTNVLIFEEDTGVFLPEEAETEDDEDDLAFVVNQMMQ